MTANGARRNGVASIVAPGFHPRTAERLTLAALVVTLLCVLFLETGAMEERRGALVAWGCATLLGGGLLYLAVRELSPDLLAPRLLVASYALQVPWIVLIAALRFPTRIWATEYAPDMVDFPFRATVPLLLVPVGGLLAVALNALVPARPAVARRLGRVLATPPAGIEIYLVLSGAMVIAYWFGSLPGSGRVGYFIRVFATSTNLLAFVAGCFAHRFRLVNILWIVALVVNAAIGLAVGGRLVALLPIALFVLGRVATYRGKQRRRTLLYLPLTAVPLLLLSGIVGIVRAGVAGRPGVGRGGLEIVSGNRFWTVYNEATSLRDLGLVSTRDLLYESLSRHVNAAHVVVPILSPEVVPYRGFEGFTEELGAASQIAAVSGMTREQFIAQGLGSAPALRYGFTVNAQTSVEFGVLADGWSRGGPYIALLFGMMLTLVLIIAERVTWRLFGDDVAAVIVLLATIAPFALLHPGSTTFVTTLRGLALNWTFLLATVVVVRLLQERRSTSPVRAV